MLVERRLDAIIVSRICVKFVVLRGKIAFEMSLRDDVGWSGRLGRNVYVVSCLNRRIEFL